MVGIFLNRLINIEFTIIIFGYRGVDIFKTKGIGKLEAGLEDPFGVHMDEQAAHLAAIDIVGMKEADKAEGYVFMSRDGDAGHAFGDVREILHLQRGGIVDIAFVVGAPVGIAEVDGGIDGVDDFLFVVVIEVVAVDVGSAVP